MIGANHPFAKRTLNALDENGNEGCAVCGRLRSAHPQPGDGAAAGAYKAHLDEVFAPVQAEVDRLRAEQERQAEQHARDMAAEDGDYDRCEPTL